MCVCSFISLEALVFAKQSLTYRLNNTVEADVNDVAEVISMSLLLAEAGLAKLND